VANDTQALGNILLEVGATTETVTVTSEVTFGKSESADRLLAPNTPDGVPIVDTGNNGPLLSLNLDSVSASNYQTEHAGLDSAQTQSYG